MPYAPGIDGDAVAEVHAHMRLMTYPFITPISRQAVAGIGELHGSGTFVALRGRPYILTNEHVVRLGVGFRLAHFVGGGRFVSPIDFPFIAAPAPIDAAIARVLPEALVGGNRSVLPTSSIDERFRAVDGEVMFVNGFPVALEAFDAGTLEAHATPLTVDLIDLPNRHDLDPAKHVAVRYPVGGHQLGGGAGLLPDPAGLSGSALWDTKYVASGANEWVPADAKVAGLIFGYLPNPSCLLATKIEVVREFLLDALRHEAAYYRYLETLDHPAGALSDWLWAEAETSDIE
jgi:hypothetical protein